MRADLNRKKKTQTEDAIHSSLTLLELGSGRASVLSTFLEGRAVALDRSLLLCCTLSTGVLDEDKLHLTISLLREKYVPSFLSVVRGLDQLFQNPNSTTLSEFALKQLKALTDKLLTLIMQAPTSPPAVRNGLVGLKEDLSSLSLYMTGFEAQETALWREFFVQAAMASGGRQFDEARTGLAEGLKELRATLAETDGETICDKLATAEHKLLLQVCLCLTDCQPLLELVTCCDTNRMGTEKFLASLLRQVQDFFRLLSDLCDSYCERELSWNFVSGLSLVRITRHFETRGGGEAMESGRR